MNPPFYNNLYWCTQCNEETTFYVPTIWPKQRILDLKLKDVGCPYLRVIMCCKCKKKYIRFRARKCKTCDKRKVECLIYPKAKGHPYRGPELGWNDYPLQ